MLRNRHVTRFGHPFTKPGARYHVSDIEGLEQAAFDIALARVASQGQVIGRLEMAQLLADTHQARIDHDNMVSRLRVPQAIVSLLSTGSKREAERIANATTITENDLFLLMHNCSQMGLKCRSRFPDFVPDHLQITATDRNDMRAGLFARISRKFTSLFAFRKVLHVHLFEADAQWHCMFFTYEDIEESTANHWKHGPHLHYVSHHWSQLDPQRIWEGFEKRRARVAGGIHVRFRPFTFTNGAMHSGMRSGLTTDHLFPMDPAQLQGQTVTPPAQVVTRGAWTADVFVPVGP